MSLLYRFTALGYDAMLIYIRFPEAHGMMLGDKAIRTQALRSIR